MQICATYNKERDFDWYKDKIIFLEESKYNSENFGEATKTANQISKNIPLGIFYQKAIKKNEETPIQLNVGPRDIKLLLDEF